MSDGFIPAILVEVIITVSGIIVSVGIPLVLTKLNKINKLNTAVFGLSEVSTVEGLVGKVNSNSERIDKLESKQRDIETSIDYRDKQ